jgi:hypothetical protein
MHWKSDARVVKSDVTYDCPTSLRIHTIREEDKKSNKKRRRERKRGKNRE